MPEKLLQLTIDEDRRRGRWMYKLWMQTATGEDKFVGEFHIYAEALAEMQKGLDMEDGRAYALEYPDGTWMDWDEWENDQDRWEHETGEDGQ